MSRLAVFCFLACVLLAAAELAAADLVNTSSPRATPLCLGLMLLATGTLASLAHVWGKLDRGAVLNS
jgi:hypothetical protein